MRQVATGKIIIFPESLFQYKEFLFSVEHIIGDNRTQIQEKLRLRCDFRFKKNKKIRVSCLVLESRSMCDAKLFSDFNIM